MSKTVKALLAVLLTMDIGFSIWFLVQPEKYGKLMRRVMSGFMPDIDGILKEVTND